MTRFSQGSLRSGGYLEDDDQDRASTPRQSGSPSRTSSLSTSSSASGSSVSGSEATRTSHSRTYSSNSGSTTSSKTRDSRNYRDSTYSTETRTSTSSSSVQAEIRDLEDMIYKFRDQLEFYKRNAEEEKRRADNAVKKAQEVTEHLKKVNEARLVAQQEAGRANEELRLYKIQLEYAQREINRAQAVLELVDKQRYAAEKQAADARAKARRLNEELLVEQARRQGRRQGMQEGLERGRTLAGPDLIRPMLGRRSSYVEQASFMEDESDTEDGRTVSTASIRSSRSSQQTETRPQSLTEPQVAQSSYQSPPQPSTPSPPPIPIPQPRAASEMLQMRTPSTVGVDLPPVGYPLSRSASRTGSVAHSEHHGPPIRNPSPTPRMSTIPMPPTIPPDNFIPVIDEDGRVRLPAPYEFHRIPPASERGSPNPYSQSSLDRLPQRQASADSASTAISEFYMLRDPPIQASLSPALSAIQEVNSMAATPNSIGYHGQDLHHQRSMSGNSFRSGRDYSAGPTSSSALGINLDYEARDEPVITRTPASSVRSFRDRSPTSVARSIRSERVSNTVPSIHIERGPSNVSRSVANDRAASVLSGTSGQGASVTSSVNIVIDVQPPSRPISEETRSVNSKSSRLSPLHSGTAPLPAIPLPSSGESNVGWSGMPGGIDDGGFNTMNDDVATNLSGRPPKDDDAVSSRLSGDYSLSTPPTGLPRSVSPPAQSTVSSITAVSAKSKGKGKKTKKR